MDVFTGDMSRRNEKEVLQTLNDRFAGYIDKVRNLEMHNRNLEAEAAELRQNQAGRATEVERLVVVMTLLMKWVKNHKLKTGYL